MAISKSRLRWILNLLTLVVLLSPLASPWAVYRLEIVSAAPLPEEKVPPTAEAPFDARTDLFRTWVTLPNATSRARLDSLGVVVLEETDTTALILADAEQLETLARLRFRPQATDDLGMLVERHAEAVPWLAQSLQPLLMQAGELRALSLDADGGTPAATPSLQQSQMNLRTALQALTTEQQAGIMSLTNIDSDGDGLTDTQEAWWCTDPLDVDTDDDGRIDKAEIDVLKQWMSNERSGPPNETPWASWPFDPVMCPDKDHDSIPNLAERWELGLDMDLESTDRDRYDDGQELFGVTYCPGSASACGYGQLPSANHDGVLLFPQMPAWVTAPGNHPVAAALPRLDFTIVPSAEGYDFMMQTATVVTTDQRHEEGETRSYSTTKTDGTSTSDAETQTWENWQEYSKTTEASGAMANLEGDVTFSSEQRLQVTNIRTTHVTNQATNVEINNSFQKQGGSELLKEISAPASGFVIDQACAEFNCTKYVGSAVRASVRTFADVVQGTIFGTSDRIQNEFAANKCDASSLSLGAVWCRVKSAGTLWQKNYDERLEAATVAEQNPARLSNGALLQTGDSYLDIGRVYPLTFPEPRFIPTETNTSGSSTGGARTTTHTTYEEHSVTEGTASQFGTSWGTATAVNSIHAADLWFAYELTNSGSDYARVICDLAINIYIGDQEAPAATYYPGQDLGGDGCFSNFQPGESHRYTFPSDSRIALTLGQMALIDQGETVKFVIEDYSLGQDDYYADDAVASDVTVAIDDGWEDNDETIDTYILAMWPDETVLDVLGRFFPHVTDNDGLLTAIWTPEYRADTPTWCDEPRVVGSGSRRAVWCKKALSTADWWNIYTNGMGDGGEGFQDTLASPGSMALFRFNKDSDLDGYSDRSELRLGTDPNDAASYPRPELLAGVHSIRVVNYVTATLSLLNTGLYDAYGVEAIMIAPNDTISITNNTVGGSGRVRAQCEVVVGSRILLQTPLPAPWMQAGHAQPTAGGHYTGQRDRTYTFTVQCGTPAGCDVSAGTWTLSWNDGASASGTLNFSTGYASPNLLSAGTHGLKLGLLSGRVFNGETFTVETRTPRDTFQYTINAEPFTPPVVVVSYNDPQGNHRFIIPPAAMALSNPTVNLATFAGQMLQDPGVEIVTTEVFTPGLNTTNLVVNNPTGVTLTDAHLFLEFVNISGTVVSEVPVTVTLPAGPSVVPVEWDTNAFSPTFQLDEDYIVLAFLTDWQGNILDTAGRPLSSFQADPKPSLAMAPDVTWNFGEAVQGTILERSFDLANTGYLDLLTYVNAPAGVTLSQQGSRTVGPAGLTTYEITLDTAVLPVGPYSQTITIRSSDSDVRERAMHVVGTIEAVSGQAHAFPLSYNRPWDEGVFIPSSHQTRDQINFEDVIDIDSSATHPLYVYDFDYQNRLGTGKEIALIARQLGGIMVSNGLEDSMMRLALVEAGDVPTPVMRNTGSASAQSSPPWWNASYYRRRQITVQAQGAVPAPYVGVGRFNLGTLTGIRADRNDVRIVYWTGSGWVEVDRRIFTDNWWLFPINVSIAANQSDSNFWLYYNNSSAGAPPANVENIYVPRYSSGVISQYRFDEGGGAPNDTGPENSDLMDRAYGTYIPGKFGYAYQSNGSDQYAFRGDGSNRWNNVWVIEFWATKTKQGASGGNENVAIAKWGDWGNIDSFFVGFWDNGDLWFMTDNANSYRYNVGLPPTWSTPHHIAMVFRRDVGGLRVYVDNVLRVDVPSGIYMPTNSQACLSLMAKGTGSWSGYNDVWGGTLEQVIISNVYRDSFPHGGVLNDPIVSVGSEQLHTGTVSGRVFRDLNNNGIQDVGETGIAGVLVNLGGAGQSRTTDSSGSYSFTEITPGNYTVSIVVSLGYVNTTPTSRGISLDPGGTASASFGLLPYFVEKLSATDHDIRLFSPEAFSEGHRYWLQFGRKVSLDAAGNQVVYVRLPKGRYSDIALDIILTQAGTGSLTLNLDVGDNGSTDWSYSGSLSTPRILTSGNLAPAFNVYLAGQPLGDVDIPIRVSLSTSGQLFLTDLVAVSTTDVDVTLTATDITFGMVSATESDTVPITVTLHNNGGLAATGHTVAFYATAPEWGEWYIGSAFVPGIPAGSTTEASIVWDTLGFTGATPVRVVVDPYNRLTELDEDNNQATASLTILTRPDLEPVFAAFSNPELVAGENVTVSLQVANYGQVAAGAFKVGLFNGNPDDGGVLLQVRDLNVPGEGEAIAPFTWTPTAPGPHRLFAQVDKERAVNESNRGNNLAWQDIYVGFAGPLLLDSGGASDPAYAAETGYGVLDEGPADVLGSCGALPHERYRLDPEGNVVYRFDHLLPGHFYHLDVTLYECDGAGRQETVLVNGHQVAGPIDLGDGQIHRLSLLLDPALYSGHTIRVEIEAEGIDGALVNEVNLYDVDYRYADAGGTRDPQYPGGALVNLGYPYGWLNGVANTAWGTLPSRSVRVNQTSNLLEYRFDGLKPEKRYNIHLSFWQPSGTARLQRIQLDGLDTGLTVNTGDFQMHQETTAVPPTAYTADGSVVVGVLRTNAATGAMVNEIALEEETLQRSGWCDVRQTPYFTDVYGDVAILSQGAPAGTVIEARNPRGDTVGCYVVGTAGQYGFMHIYGEDTTAIPAIPGMRAGELVAFHVNGAPAVATPQLYWQVDYATHRVDLNAGSITGQSILFQAGWNLISFRLEPPMPTVRQVLGSIEVRYDRVLGEYGAYAPDLPDVFNTLKELHPGLGYFVRISGSTSASALIEGLTVPVTTPIPLHPGWNWIGYLPEATLPITVALQSIEGQYQRVLSLDKTYAPAFPGFSTLHSMEPGKGYLIYANGAVTLTYPVAGALLNVIPQRSVSSGCENLNPTPKFTLLYGNLLLGDQPTPAGSRVEVLTPRGDIAGCLVLDKPGVIGFMQVYGEDATTSTPIPGFRDGEELTFRINGVPVETGALLWRDDWMPHTITLKVDRFQLYLPLVIRDGE